MHSFWEGDSPRCPRAVLFSLSEWMIARGKPHAVNTCPALCSSSSSAQRQDAVSSITNYYTLVAFFPANCTTSFLPFLVVSIWPFASPLGMRKASADGNELWNTLPSFPQPPQKGDGERTSSAYLHHLLNFPFTSWHTARQGRNRLLPPRPGREWGGRKEPWRPAFPTPVLSSFCMRPSWSNAPLLTPFYGLPMHLRSIDRPCSLQATFLLTRRGCEVPSRCSTLLLL